MNSKSIKKGIIVAMLACAILIPSGQAFAADTTSLLSLPKQGKEVVLDQNVLVNAIAEISDNKSIQKFIKIETSEEIRLSQMLSEKVFAVIGEEGHLLVKSEADENSDWSGKIYEGNVLEIVKRGDIWTEVKSGNIEGFVKNEDLITGDEALEMAKAILTEKYPEIDITTLDQYTIDGSFTVGETKAEEEARLAAEEAKRIAEEQARIAAEKAALEAKGQSVVDYAKQFLGNPYVWGGTSLTRGTDCSGFVKSVYANFGISMPRTSYYMRSVGQAVSYSEMMPGDVVCYSGHVGIYAGNGQIINAIDEAHGIGMSSVNYAKIITIRRMF